MGTATARLSRASVAWASVFVPALLFAGAALLSALTMLKGIQPNDEGLMLQAAARIADGQVPYGDFWWFYPPGQPYLLAGLWEIFGPSLLPWRVVRVLSDATVALLVYLLARRFAGPWPALAGWLAGALAMAFPSGPHPYPLALAFALGAFLACGRFPLGAGLLVALCSAWRLEFGAFAAVGILLAYSARPGQLHDRLRAAARFAAGALAGALALYAPVVLAAGVSESWELLVRFPLLDFRDYQSLPLPTAYDGDFSLASPRAAADTVGSLLHFYLPLVLLVTGAAALLRLAFGFRRERWSQVAPAVFTVGMASYLLVRPDLFHTAPLAVMVSVLAPWAVAAGGEGERRWASPAIVAAALSALGLAWVVANGADHKVRGIAEETRPLSAPVADGVEARPEEAPALNAAVAYVRERLPEGAPLYMTGRRADIVTAGNVLFYVLADRPNPTRYDIAQPGVVTTASVQEEIIATLRRRRPLVVRWTDRLTAAPEPNRAGRSSGVRALDEYLSANYRREERFGSYSILRPRGPG